MFLFIYLRIIQIAGIYCRYFDDIFQASDEEIFQYARKIVIAETQAITLREYAPSVIGRKLPQYKGFNPKVNSGITTEFSHAAFRFAILCFSIVYSGC